MKDIIEEEMKEFEKRNVYSHPGDSGPGGNTPQEPVWELQIEGPSDLRNELRSFANKIIKSFAKEVEERVIKLTSDEFNGDWSEEEGKNPLIAYNNALKSVRSTLKELEKEVGV